MNKRLIWNFEISTDTPFNWTDLKGEKDELRWEARYFWPDNTPILLHGLDDSFLDLNNYEVKHREDCYSLVAGKNYNIKKRREELLYKPLLKQNPPLNGFGKKINLASYPANQVLPGTDDLHTPALFKLLENQQQEIQVIKDALIYTLTSKPKIKIELARLEAGGKIYFTVCIEGRSEFMVANLAKHLLGEQISCDYVSFLKKALTS